MQIKFEGKEWQQKWDIEKAALKKAVDVLQDSTLFFPLSTLQ